VQPERRAHRLRQFGHRGRDLPQGLARGRGRLGRARAGVGRVRGGVEAGEQAPLEAAPPRPVEGEIANHPPDIGCLEALRGLRRIGDEPEHHVLDHVLRLRRAVQDPAGAREIGGAVALERRGCPAGRAGRDRGRSGAVAAGIALQGCHRHAHTVTLARAMQS
jgi:hypothetical protein